MTWRQAELGALVKVGGGMVQTGPFGSQLHQAEYVVDGTPVVMPKDIIASGIDEVSVARVADQTASRLRRHSLAARTIVLPRRGDISKRAIVQPHQVGWICGTGCIQIVVGQSELLPEFLFYFLELSDVVAWLEQHAVGSTMLNLSAAIVKQLPIRFPSKAQQAQITEALLSFDNLITNNRRRMALVERAARELYNQWFVRLRFPGHERARSVDALPEGWERRPLGACAKFQSGGTPSKARADFWDGDIPWVSSGELTEFRIRRTSLSVSAEGVADGSRMVPPETILAVVRGMSLAKEFRIGLTSIPMSFNQDLKAIVASEGIDTLMLFHALDAQRDQIRDKAGEASHGTKKLDTAVLAAVPITVPPFSVQQAFRSHVQPLHAQWDNLEQQNVKLRAARDLLLPRLMNGSIAP